MLRTRAGIFGSSHGPSVSEEVEVRMWIAICEPSGKERRIMYSTHVWISNCINIHIYCVLSLYMLKPFRTTKKHIHIDKCTYIHTYMHACMQLHYITLHFNTLHYTTLHYITYIHSYMHTYIHACYITLHYVTLGYVTLHYITYNHTHTYMRTYIHMCLTHNNITCQKTKHNRTYHNITWHYIQVLTYIT